MRLQLLDRVRRSWRRRKADKARTRQQAEAVAGPGSGPAAPAGPAGAHRKAGGSRAGPRQARGGPAAPGDGGASASRHDGDGSADRDSAGSVRRHDGGGPGGSGPRPGSPASLAEPGRSAGRAARSAPRALPRRRGIARVATRSAPGADAAAETAARTQARGARADTARVPWYEIAQSNRTAVGRRHCGHIEPLVHREWADGVMPPPEVLRAIDRLAELPQLIKSKLAAGLDAIHVGMGGVPDLDDMGRLSGVPLPSGRATWDACAGAYGERKIIVGSRLSPSPDVMCHEIGHALDDIDGADEQWQSDSAEFQSLYDQCLPHMVSAFHQQRGLLGRREFFADAFAAIASRQRPALVEMLGGDTRAALNVMLYFNVRYGI